MHRHASEATGTDMTFAAYERAGIDLTPRMQPGYDNRYHFISTVMADHVGLPAEWLK